MRYVILAPVALLVWGAILFPIASGIYGLIKWRGFWRVASAVPVLMALLFLAPILANPGGWWGLVFIPVAMLLSVYSGVVVLLHRKRAR
ncbi:MAG: hypothetical protein P4L56_07170 [Candidatus Sulfopaludibacter sp.]|nr:hypothetical protein [Candidatus Sulfopaludibacter sp.]